jgi:hypothetical protein
VTLKVSGLAELQRMSARFAPVDIGAPIDRLPDGERRALATLVEAAEVMHALFLEQVWAGNPALLVRLAGDRTALGRARLRGFLINKGPWSRLDRDAPFIPGVPAKPPQANFYPSDATKEQIKAWIGTLDPDERALAAGFFSTIPEITGSTRLHPRPETTGSTRLQPRLETGSTRLQPRLKTTLKGRTTNRATEFVAVPYSLEYQGTLARAAALLRKAAGETAEPSLKRFLELRAGGFLSNDYSASDVAWMAQGARARPRRSRSSQSGLLTTSVPPVNPIARNAR